MESDEKYIPGFRELTAVLMLVVAVLTWMANKKSADETGRTSQLADKHAKLQTWQQRATLSVSSVQLERMDDRSYLSDQRSRYRLRVRLRNHGEFSAQNVLMVMNADLGRWSGVKELGVLGKGEETELQFVSGRLTEDAKDKMAAFAIAFRMMPTTNVSSKNLKLATSFQCQTDQNPRAMTWILRPSQTRTCQTTATLPRWAGL